ncbi:hypothetical protein HNV10_01830 [Winogradskyella litoriviva]|uniref:Uncharacterized protein n=1 Tax=Winogradskyella litoriviva TaxID=1220182 RepID=A0ABX2E0G3_9FLAO|nr:hypothetical protein [Winogradskyella litoriviva]NRD21962.1 hypothetical protein [Winogradskyella litoriviva]
MKVDINKIISLPFIYIGLLSLLDFFLKDYDDRNNYNLSTGNYLIIFTVAVCAVMLFVLKNSQETDKFIKIAKSFAYGIFFGFISVIYVTLVKNQTGFYLNRIYTKSIVEEDFEIFNRGIFDKDSIVGLRSMNDDYWFMTYNKFSYEDLLLIEDNDTIKIKMGIGVFNRPFLYNGKIEIVK